MDELGLIVLQVIDSSDVVLHVLDARDPLGTRCRSVEKYIKEEAPHKHLIFVLNKCDLVPTSVAVSLPHKFPALLSLHVLFLVPCLSTPHRSSQGGRRTSWMFAAQWWSPVTTLGEQSRPRLYSLLHRFGGSALSDRPFWSRSTRGRLMFRIELSPAWSNFVSGIVVALLVTAHTFLYSFQVVVKSICT